MQTFIYSQCVHVVEIRVQINAMNFPVRRVVDAILSFS